MLVAGIAMLLALALVELLLPSLGHFLDADLAHELFRRGAACCCRSLAADRCSSAPRAASTRPSICRASSRPQVLKANKSTAEAAGSGRLRNALVVGQFAVSIGLIICTAVVYAQTVYARTADPGFSREGLLQVDGLSRRQLIDRAEAIAARDASASRASTSVGRTGIGIDTAEPEQHRASRCPGRDEPVDDRHLSGRRRISSGRWASSCSPAASSTRTAPLDDDAACPIPPTTEDERALAARGVNVVINERGAARLGFADPADAVGKQFTDGPGRSENRRWCRSPSSASSRTRRFRSIREPLEPIMFVARNHGLATPGRPLRRAEPQRGARAASSRPGSGIAPDVPFDGRVQRGRSSPSSTTAEEARAQIFAGFAVLAVIVACLGLFGLAAFTAERRTKEIGIRKVLGARTRDIVRLLAWQFSKPVIIANLIAWPVAWWVMRDWLNSFDARIDLGADAVPARRPARAGDRDRHHRRPRHQGRPRQSHPRPALRIGPGTQPCGAII